jgi:hypothetical protein
MYHNAFAAKKPKSLVQFEAPTNQENGKTSQPPVSELQTPSKVIQK